MAEKKEVITSRKYRIDQDWASVVIGFGLIIFVALAGYTISTPSFGGKPGWSDFQGIAAMFVSSSLGISLISTLLIFGVFCGMVFCVLDFAQNES